MNNTTTPTVSSSFKTIREITGLIKISNAGSLKKVIKEEDIFLPGQDHWAYQVANEINSKMETSQIRNIFDIIVSAYQKRNQFTEARDTLYMVVPLVAYSVGRKLFDENFYNLICACINEKRIQAPEDIETFYKFFESIIAYFKFLHK